MLHNFSPNSFIKKLFLKLIHLVQGKQIYEGAFKNKKKKPGAYNSGLDFYERVLLNQRTHYVLSLENGTTLGFTLKKEDNFSRKLTHFINE